MKRRTGNCESDEKVLSRLLLYTALSYSRTCTVKVRALFHMYLLPQLSCARTKERKDDPRNEW